MNTTLNPTLPIIHVGNPIFPYHHWNPHASLSQALKIMLGLNPNYQILVLIVFKGHDISTGNFLLPQLLKSIVEDR